MDAHRTKHRDGRRLTIHRSQTKVTANVSPTNANASAPRKRRARWPWWLAALALAIFLLAVWLNGPGLRWLGPAAASHFAARADVEVSMRIEGSLLSGLTVRDITIIPKEGPLLRLDIYSATPVYLPAGLLRGEILGLKASGIHAVVTSPPEKKESSPEPPDFDAIAATLRQTRTLLLPYSLDLRDITAEFRQDGGDAVVLASTGILRASGESITTLRLGAVTSGEREWIGAQEITFDWAADAITIAPVKAHPLVNVESLTLHHPDGGGVMVDGTVAIGDAVFIIASSPENATATVQLREGRLTSAVVEEILGQSLPVQATLTSLMLDADNLMPDPANANASLGILLEDITFDGHQLREIAAELLLNPDDARIVIRAATADAEIRVDATTTIDRIAPRPLETRGNLEIPAVVPWLHAFPEIVVLPEDADAFPPASLAGDFDITWDATPAPAPATAGASLTLRPEDADVATTVTLAARWAGDAAITANLEADGIEAVAEIDTEGRSYQASATLASFDSKRIEGWLAAAGIRLPGNLLANAGWEGHGPLGGNEHNGSLDLTSAEWLQGDLPPVVASATLEYMLPSAISASSLRVARDGQSINADAALADGMLTLDRLVWTDADGTVLAEASGSIPFPDNPAQWRQTLADDGRPLELSVKSRPLTFEKISTWLPALAAADPAATAVLDTRLSGTFAQPVLDASFHLHNLSVPEQPAVPPANLEITASGRDGALAIAGEITTADFPPVTLSANLPFTPAAWADDPELLANAPLSATANLPRLDIARFAALAPGTRTLNGILTGRIQAGGTISSPVLDGRLDLTNGGVAFENPSIPEISRISAAISFNTDRASLESLNATIAGGGISATGAFDIQARTLSARVRGSHVPVMRNENLILRANADVQASGPFDAVAISGSIAIVDSMFFRDIEILPIGTPFTGPQAAALPEFDKTAATASIPEPFANWPLDLTITTADPFLIRGNLATGRVDADLRIRGTISNPAPNGRARLSRGRASLPFSTLNIPEASLIFTPANGFDPTIELRGIAEPRPYTVNLYAYGRLSNPQIVLTSTPPLAENEIMTLLATGTTTSGLEDPQAASARALQLLGEEVRRGRVPYSNQLRPLLGLFDRVDFSIAESDPYSSDTFSTANLKLHDRWYLNAGMGEEGNTRMFAIWRLRFH